jgi:Na+-transporting NADH:ubiquinone oxidoreductase subunit F
MESELPDFRFVPVVWKPAENEKWEGERGLVTEVLERELPDAGDAEAYLCGAPGMIDACVRVFRARGLPEERIYYDKFA